MRKFPKTRVDVGVRRSDKAKTMPDFMSSSVISLINTHFPAIIDDTNSVVWICASEITSNVAIRAVDPVSEPRMSER